MLNQAKCTHRMTISINSEACSNIRWWHLSWNGVSMLQEKLQKHPNHEFWSDASGSCGGGNMGQTLVPNEMANHAKLL